MDENAARPSQLCQQKNQKILERLRPTPATTGHHPAPVNSRILSAKIQKEGGWVVQSESKWVGRIGSECTVLNTNPSFTVAPLRLVGKWVASYRRHVGSGARMNGQHVKLTWKPCNTHQVGRNVGIFTPQENGKLGSA